MPPTERIDCQIPASCAGMRLDQALAELLPTYSRNRLQHWLKTGQLRVDGHIRRPRDPVSGGETVCGELAPATETTAVAQDIPLAICYEDADLLVINKPARPGGASRGGPSRRDSGERPVASLPELATLPRAGLVHRLDQDTTGLLVVARRLRAHTALVEQLQARRIERDYLAVVNGAPVAGGMVDAPVGRHPVDRQRMAVTPDGKASGNSLSRAAPVSRSYPAAGQAGNRPHPSDSGPPGAYPPAAAGRSGLWRAATVATARIAALPRSDATLSAAGVARGTAGPGSSLSPVNGWNGRRKFRLIWLTCWRC